jgi:uncharacterized protein YjiS (DUF1127 family)
MTSLITGASCEVSESLRHRKSSPADLGQPGLRWRSVGNPLGRGILWLFFTAAAPLVVWQQRLRDRTALQRMPEHMLRDIGLDATAAQAEADKPFWRT